VIKSLHESPGLATMIFCCSSILLVVVVMTPYGDLLERIDEKQSFDRKWVKWSCRNIWYQ